MKNFYLLFGLAVLFIISCGNDNNKDVSETNSSSVQADPLREKAVSFFAVLPDKAENPDNPSSESKIKLGNLLYLDTRLSKNGNNSCNTCHNLAAYGVDNLPVSKGDEGKDGTRNSPTTFNAALNTIQFWDGREPDVEAQAGGPVLNPVEMDIPSEEFMVNRLKNMKEYSELFKSAFPGSNDPVTFENMKKAIGAFERTLLTPAKFDRYLKGENVLTEQEKKGMETFINTGCIACHKGALLGGDSFQKFQYNDKDKGRFDVTKKEADMYMFKTPSLRNIEKTYPYFHDGDVDGLDEAVKIMAKTQLNKDLSDEEINDIVAFLKTFTGHLPDNVQTEL